MSARTESSVLILGANGRFGRTAADAFSRAGWRVTAQSRSSLRYTLPHGVTPLQCDALGHDALLQACARGVDVIVNALNPVYTDWERKVPPLAEAALALAHATGALLMLPGNVYNFGSRLPEVLTEQTPFAGDTSKARIRIELENRMQAAAASGVRSVVIRAGDFLGGDGPGTWLDMVMAKKLGSGKFTYPGPLDVPHAWAYLPDLARVFVAVAERRQELAPFEVLHYAGVSCTGTELRRAVERASASSLGVAQMPWWLMRLLAPVVPICRAMLEMRYLWLRPHRLDETKLRALVHDVPHTPLEQVVSACLAAVPGKAAGATVGPAATKY